MIDFFFKRKPIQLDCFTSSVHAYEFAPIATANNFMPDWWKALPKTFTEGNTELGTMKTCAGFIDLYGKGLMIPLWYELAVRLWENGNYQYNFADMVSFAEHHTVSQVGTFFEDASAIHFKIRSPWHFKCKDDISWHFAQPVWNQQAAKDYCVPTGVLNFKYSTATEINILFKKENKIINFPHGTPMAHIIPLSERPIHINNHLVSPAEINKIASMNHNISFRGGHYKRKKILENREPKCPFGFGSR